MSQERAPVCHEDHGKTCRALARRRRHADMLSELLSDRGTGSGTAWDVVSSAWPVTASRESNLEEQLNTLCSSTRSTRCGWEGFLWRAVHHHS